MTQTPNYSLNLFETTDKMNPTTLDGLNANTNAIDTALAGMVTGTLVTTITSSSTDTQIPSAKAVYSLVPNITYGTTDLTPGVSELAEGTFYFYYE